MNDLTENFINGFTNKKLKEEFRALSNRVYAQEILCFNGTRIFLTDKNENFSWFCNVDEYAAQLVNEMCYRGLK